MKINIFKQVYPPFFRFFRTRRMQKFIRSFHVTGKTKILDVGGTPAIWKYSPVQPDLFLLNLSGSKQADQNIERKIIIADGRHLPFRDKSFDIAYSNSTIEHLGGYEQQILFSNEIRRAARSYYVQTPNKWFPIEPHYFTPLIHWLPRNIQKKLLRNFSIRGLLMRPSQEECEEIIDRNRLLEIGEFRALFPEAVIWRERILGLTKSLIAVKITE